MACNRKKGKISTKVLRLQKSFTRYPFLASIYNVFTQSLVWSFISLIHNITIISWHLLLLPYCRNLYNTFRFWYLPVLVPSGFGTFRFWYLLGMLNSNVLPSLTIMNLLTHIVYEVNFILRYWIAQRWGQFLYCFRCESFFVYCSLFVYLFLQQLCEKLYGWCVCAQCACVEFCAWLSGCLGFINLIAYGLPLRRCLFGDATSSTQTYMY